MDLIKITTERFNEFSDRQKAVMIRDYLLAQELISEQTLVRSPANHNKQFSVMLNQRWTDHMVTCLDFYIERHKEFEFQLCQRVLVTSATYSGRTGRVVYRFDYGPDQEHRYCVLLEASNASLAAIHETFGACELISDEPRDRVEQG